MVDLHTGWTSSRIDEQSLRLCSSGQPVASREMDLLLSMVQAYHTAQVKLREDLVPQIKTHEEDLKTACQVEQKQVSEHYQTMMPESRTEKPTKVRHRASKCSNARYPC